MSHLSGSHAGRYFQNFFAIECISLVQLTEEMQLQ